MRSKLCTTLRPHFITFSLFPLLSLHSYTGPSCTGQLVATSGSLYLLYPLPDTFCPSKLHMLALLYDSDQLPYLLKDFPDTYLQKPLSPLQGIFCAKHLVLFSLKHLPLTVIIPLYTISSIMVGSLAVLFIHQYISCT